MKIDFNFSKIDIRSFHTLVFDFDGVFTDNSVYISHDGIESVKCHRSDGLGISKLKSLKIPLSLNIGFISKKFEVLNQSSNPKLLGLYSSSLKIGAPGPLNPFKCHFPKWPVA